ncbi:MAG: PilT/PilU family type 4a pilus ATPase [Verrucomicrobiota bacterium]|nr:PilT/PilU family type 4a pilus ATPase [Verrucomicrobiota bacterium]
MNGEIVDALLSRMLASGEGVSDLLFIPGKPPLVEIHGHLHDFPIDTPERVMTPALIEQLAAVVINGSERLQAELTATGSCDCSYAIENLARFRVNVFRQNGRPSVVMRRLESEIPSLEKLALPPIFREMVREKNGIILITGGTGTGKTTTLAALIDELNRTQQIHILTLEDPIEFFHGAGRAAISQRELGKDFPNFADGLRAALRQAPKVILVGEIRDRETLEIAMSASETGHLVLSTLHTVNAGQTISRILGMYKGEEEPQVRQRVAETLRYIVSQRLVPKISGGRLLVTEIMGSSLRTRETIVYGESENKSFCEIIEAGSTLGWHSFDQSLLVEAEAGVIADETAMTYSTNKNKMRRDLDLMLKVRGLAKGEMHSGLKLQGGQPMPMTAGPSIPRRVITPR